MTDHIQPYIQINQVNQTGRTKSRGLAFLLTFCLGPLGMLYSTVLGAFLMGFVLICLGAAAMVFPPIVLTYVVALPCFWAMCCLWAVLAA